MVLGDFFFIRYFANFNLYSGYVVSSKPARCVCLVIWFQALSVLVKICVVMAVTANYFEQFWSIHSLIVQTTLKDFLRTFLEGAMALRLMPSTPKRGLELRPGTLFCVLGQLTLLEEYKWVAANCKGNLTNCRGVTCDDPGEVEILQAASWYRNRGKLRQL